jgi:hypothetical protein
MTEEYRQNTRNQSHTFINEGQMISFQSQGSCYICWKTGHRTKEFILKRINNSNPKNYKRFQGKCGTCEICIHTTKDC